ncbi:MAG: hypothetical protein QXG10_00245 [Candidatus Hadarchaeales archaeon]
MLYSVILGMLIFALFMAVYERQMDMRVQEEASSLADELGRTAFAALSGEQPFKDLPPSLGGSYYAVEVRDNSVIVVRITHGRGYGTECSSFVNFNLKVENGSFLPGGRVYFMRVGESLIISSSPVQAPEMEIFVSPTSAPPEFYNFAKHSARVAAGMIASYFSLSDIGYIAAGYSTSEDRIYVRWTRGAEEAYFETRWDVSDQRVGNVMRAWVLSGVNRVGSSVGSMITCDENLDNAVAGGWLFSGTKALQDLRNRTWKNENSFVNVPSDADIVAACVETNIGRMYPVWRISWDNYVIYYRAIPWWENDDSPGFIFQSYPEIEPVV